MVGERGGLAVVCTTASSAADMAHFNQWLWVVATVFSIACI